MGTTQTTASGPGRPREFEIENAVRDAMRVFQDRGYADTSLSDLMEGTGLSRGSLYKAFVSKQGLFLAALDRYTTQNIEALRANLASAPGKVGIRTALLEVARASSLEMGRIGCLLVNSTTELASKDPEVRERVVNTFTRLEGLLSDAVRVGQAADEIDDAQDPADIARFLLCTVEGMGVLGKTGRTQEEMALIVDVALRAL
ncbi:TetR/AcrR family transcriptional regulator [Streptomyces sp. NPDC091972]|uniref:TetR/AcrR family transcriptional regulator n=1 Tax=Streptomyces sp. NPDC091972 TaxID=3366007 RepID=UPI0037F2AAFF